MSIDLSVARSEPVASVVDMFEDLLRRAKSGEVRSAIVCGTCAGGTIYHAHDTAEGGRFELIGAVEAVKARILEERR